MKSLIGISLIFLFLIACGSDKKGNKRVNESSNKNYEYYNEESEDDNGEEVDYYETEETNRFEDGTYLATVDYYNPVTAYSATYTLEVEVESNQVTVIYFLNDGYLDDDHIWPAELDDDGFVSIDGEGGKTYDIQIDY